VRDLLLTANGEAVAYSVSTRFSCTDAEGAGKGRGEFEDASSLFARHVMQLIRQHDKTKSGALSLQEFVDLHQFLIRMQSSYQYFDQSRTGALQGAEVERALQHAGFTLDGQVLAQVCKIFDPLRTNALSFDQFISVTIFLKSCTDTFVAFDPQRTGMIHLDLNQFIWAATKTR